MKFYKLINEDGLIYVGSTNCKYLASRLAVHKSQALTHRLINKCKSEILFRDNKKVEIKLLYETDETDKQTLKDIERKYINENDCVNKIQVGLDYQESKKNWLNKNPHYFRDYQRKNPDKTTKKKWVCPECNLEMLNTSKYRHYKRHHNKM